MNRIDIPLLVLAFACAGGTAAAQTKQTLTHELLWSFQRVGWLEGTTSRYKAIVSHAGLASLDMQWAMSDSIYHRELMMGGPYWENPQQWIEQSPLAKGGSFKTPMLLSVGENDFRVPEGNTLAMYSVLQRMKVPSKLLIWPDENHWILKGENSRVFYREVRAWLEKYLLPASAGSQ